MLKDPITYGSFVNYSLVNAGANEFSMIKKGEMVISGKTSFPFKKDVSYPNPGWLKRFDGLNKYITSTKIEYLIDRIILFILVRRFYRHNISLFVKIHPVNANLAIKACRIAHFYSIGITKSMVNNIPLIFSRNL
ncbi:hypothetical protein QF042_004774 [Pedobacter sp. W3I1]|nr:hypothetical protein [Pedobacter sp. W3I1]